jgi:hypothetical protein
MRGKSRTRLQEPTDGPQQEERRTRTAESSPGTSKFESDLHGWEDSNFNVTQAGCSGARARSVGEKATAVRSGPLEDARKHYEVRVDALIKEAGDALLPKEQQQLRQAAESVRDLTVPEIMRFRRPRPL